MPTPTLTDPPSPPLSTDPENFDVRADAWYLWFQTHFTEEEAFIAWLAELGSTYLLSMAGTSTTPLTIGTGSKTLTTQAGLGYRKGATIYVSDASGNQMVGDVDTYSGTSLTFISRTIQGSGTASSWTIGPAVLAPLKPNDSQTAVIAKGNSGTGTVTFAVAAGEVQTLTNTGAHTWAMTWPTGYSNLEVQVTNAGLNAITLPTVNWVQGNGTTSTTFSTMNVTLQASGKNHFFFWTYDGGATVYGKAA